MTSGAAKEVPSFQPTNRLEHRSNSPASLLARDISNISTPHLIRPLGRLWERFQAIWSNRLIVAALSGFGSKRTLLNDFELLVSHQPNDPLFATRNPCAQQALLDTTRTVSTAPFQKEH